MELKAEEVIDGIVVETGVKIPGSTMAEIEKHAILETLKVCYGSTSKASKMLGISVRKIQYRLREWGMRAGDVNPAPPAAVG